MSTIADISQSAPSSQKGSLIHHHPLITYFVLAFACTWITVLPALLSRSGFGLIPASIPFLPFQILGSFTGPALAAFIVTASISGRAGMVQLLRRYVEWHVGFQWYLVALLGFPALYLLATSLLLGTTPLNALMNQWPLFFTVYLPTLLFGLISPLGEETGWRGFALPRLQQRHGALLGSLILGSLWALWHLPLYFVTTPGGVGPFNPTLFGINSLQIIIVTIFITWVFNNTMGSLLIAVLLHASSNATPTWFLKLIPTFPPLIGLIGFVLFIMSAALIIAFTKGRLSYTSNRVTQPVEAFQTAKRSLTN